MSDDFIPLPGDQIQAWDGKPAQPIPSDPVDTAHLRIDALEAIVGRILTKLDPNGTCRTLFPVDKDGRAL